MFSDLFSIKGSIVLTGIAGAIKALSSLTKKAKDAAEEIDEANQKLNESLNKEFRRMAMQQGKAVEHLITGYRKLGKTTLQTKVNFESISSAINKSGLGLSKYNARLKENAKAHQRAAALAKLNSDAEEQYYNDIIRSDRAASRAAANRRREVLKAEREAFRALTPQQRIAQMRETEPEFNPRGANARERKKREQELERARNEERAMRVEEANKRTAKENAAISAAEARMAARARARAAEQKKIDRRLGASGGNTPADPPPGYIAPPGGFGGGGGLPPSRNPFAGGQGFSGLAEKAATKFKASFASMRSSLSSFSQSVGNTLKLFGVFAAYDLWRTFIRGAREAISYAVKFNQEIANLNSVAKLSEPKLAEVSESLRTMYRRTGVGVDQEQAAKGIRDLYALGYTDIDKAMAVTEQASRLSKLGFVDMDKAVQLLGSTMQAYGADASEAEKYANALLASADLGTVTMEQFATSIGRVLPFAVQTGVSVEELSSLIGVATSGALRGETAITGLGEAFEKFSGVHRTKAAVEMLDQFGIKLDASTLKADKFIPTLKKIANEAAEAGLDLLTVFSTLAGSRSGGRSLLALLDKKGGFTKLDAGYAQVKAGGQMDARQEKYLQGPEAQIELFMSLVKDAGLQLIAQLTPAFVGLMKKLNGELRPALDNIIHNLGLLLQGFTKLFAVGGDGTLKGTLEAVNDAIIAVSGSLAEVKLAITVFINIVRFLFNFVSLIASGLMGLVDTLAKAVENPLNTSAILEQARHWNAPILEDLKDMHTAWDNVWNSGDVYEKALGENNKFMSKVKKNVIDTKKEIDAEMVKAISRANPGLSMQSAAKKQDTFTPRKTVFDKLTAQEKRELINTDPSLRKFKNMPQVKGALEQQVYREYGVSQPLNLKTDRAHQILTKLKPPGTDDKQFQEDFRYSIMSKDPKWVAEQEKKLKAKNKAKVAEFEKTHKSNGNNEPDAVKDDKEDTADKEKLDFKELIKDLQHQVKLEKISKQEAVSKWKEMLALSKEHNANLDIQRKIESEIFKLNKDITKEKTKQIKESSEDIKMKLKAGVITPDEAMQQFGDLLKQAKSDPNTDPFVTRDIMASLYNTNKKGKKDTSKKLGLEAEAELAQLKGDGLKAELLDLDAEFTKYEKFQGDKTKINELYAKKRLAIEQRYAMEEAQLKQDMLNQITANQAAVLRAKGEDTKADMLELKAANAQRYLDLQSQVQAWRDKGVSEVEITKFIESEKLKVIAEAKTKKEALEKPPGPQSVSGTSADPRYLVEQQQQNESVGFSFGSFSIGAGGGRAIDRKANDLAKKEALEKSRFAFSLDKLKGTKGIGADIGSAVGQKTVDQLNAKKDNNDTLTLIIKQADGGGEKEVYNKIYKKSDGSYSTENVKLGGFK